MAYPLAEADVLEALALRSGMNVAEIGAARFPEAVANAVAPHGRVFAADTASVSDLPDDCCDRILMANVWTEAADPLDVLRHAARALREHGRLIVVESAVPFEEMLRILEHNCWDVHRHGDAGSQSYFIEAGVSDQSVQS